MASVGQVEEVDIETINEVPKAIRAVEQRHDVLYKLQAHLPGKEVDELNHEVGDNRVCHHRSVIGDIAGSINYQTDLVELGQNPGNIGRIGGQKISVSQFMDVTDQSVFHFLINKSCLTVSKKKSKADSSMLAKRLKD